MIKSINKIPVWTGEGNELKAVDYRIGTCVSVSSVYPLDKAFVNDYKYKELIELEIDGQKCFCNGNDLIVAIVNALIANGDDGYHKYFRSNRRNCEF